MNFRLIAVGKPSHDYAQLGIAEYLKRLKKYGSFELVYVKDGNSEVVSERLLKAAKDTYLIALDETGKPYSSRGFADQIRLWMDEPQIKTISFIIGASDGHTASVRDSAQKLISLSQMTMMHELALVVMLEQLYRAHTILRGEPYHR